MKKIFLTILSLISLNSFSQEKIEGNIKGIGKWTNNSVVLRWAPSNAAVWQQTLQGNYIIERRTFSKDTSQIIKSEFKKLIGNVHCLTLEQMKAKLGAGSEYGAVAAQCIYGKQFTISAATASDLNNASIEQKNKYSFALYAAENDTATASAIGLRWVDYTAQSGYYYVYKIYFENNIQTLKIDTAIVVVSTMPHENKISLPTLIADGVEFAIKLNWNQTNFVDVFSGYYLEKKELNSKDWVRLNKRPMVRSLNEENPGNNFFYTDSVKKNYEKYDYRLVGVTAFAEQIISSESITAYGKDVTPPNMATDLKFTREGKSGVKISWQKKVLEIDFNGFKIQHAEKIDGPWSMISTSIIDKKITNFIDKNIDETKQNYYRVLCLDTANNVSVSFPVYVDLPDSIAPANPIAPLGSISKKGVVSLHWKKGIENDLMGYRIYRANQENHDFINITPSPITDTLFIDTISISTLTKKIFYKIVAVDFHYNHSDYSPMLMLIRPDIIRPVTPLFTTILVTDSLVKLSWINSSSDDVKETYLIRAEDKKQKMIVAKFEGTLVSNYFDRNIEGKKIYRYYLVVKDESGFVTDTSFSIDAQVMAKQLNTEIKAVSILYNKATKHIELKWQMNLNEPGYYVIYKSENGNALESYKSIDSNNKSFTDYDVSKNKTYQYGIVYFLNDGRQTLMSKASQINISE